MLREGLDDIDKNGQVGDWAFLGHDHLVIRYGEDAFTGTVVIPISTDPKNSKVFWWNGSKDSPTISPSILVHANYYSGEWHGFLENGVLRKV